MAGYHPTAVPKEAPPALKAWLQLELHRISGALSGQAELRLKVLHAAPARPADGMIVYADGADWNPGSGEGFYGREGGAWVKL